MLQQLQSLSKYTSVFGLGEKLARVLAFPSWIPRLVLYQHAAVLKGSASLDPLLVKSGIRVSYEKEVCQHYVTSCAASRARVSLTYQA